MKTFFLFISMALITPHLQASLDVSPISGTKKIAITLSYAGMNRSVPANYGTYDLSNIFAIFRPVMELKQ